MKLYFLLSLLGIGSLTASSNIRPLNYEAHDYYVLHLESTISPTQIAVKLGLKHEGQLGKLADHHVFSTYKQEEDVVHRAIKERRKIKRMQGDSDILDNIKFAQKQKLKARMEKRGIVPPNPQGRQILTERQNPSPDLVAKQSEIATSLGIKDPIFTEQWHLMNVIQPGHDVNVSGVWLQGITGHNSTVAIVDDGLDMFSDDLKENYFAEGSYDFNDNSLEPKPRLSDDRHGTRCAGEVSAVKNNVCGVGVAWNSKVAGIRILSKLISDADEAVALNYAYERNQIYSCSWGPPDDGKSMDAPGILIKRAMLNAVQNGRGGLGSIYVFASGNGAANQDNCNFDGYTNSIYSITVGAIDRKGLHPYYSEKCSAQLVVTYSSGSGDAIHTTDVGANQCYSGHGGTSAAAPLAAGIFALVLQVRPDLSWRDMQYLVMQTALPVDLDTGEWQSTSIGLKYSHTFGYGKIDTWATIEAAKTYQKVNPQAWYFSPWIHVKQEIPQGESGLAASFEVTEQMLKDANLKRLEHVTVTMNVKHGRRGDLSVELTSPEKVVSHLSAVRSQDSSTEGYNDWTFMSVVHWGESGVGTWTIIIKDTQINEFNGTFIDWHLKLWGESIDPDKATLLPMPSDHDDDNHDQIIISTTTIAASTTTLAPQTTMTEPLSQNPTDHPERPQKPPKTTQTTSGVATPTSTSEVEPPTSSAETWLPSFFPTFGVSARTQIWIYGATASIIIFCSGLAIYLYLARRKRLRNNPRDEWEFDLLEDEEGEGLNSGGSRRAMKGGRRRAGELYDAFAAGSEDDSGDEYVDSNEGGDEREKRLYEDDDDESTRHVIGDDDDDDDEVREEKVTPREERGRLLTRV
ncbi:Kexin [Podosphaera aphanis]|nr:Kexin [Podosphaera aphanis]